MSDQFQTERFNVSSPPVSWELPLLPAWLARRLLRSGETVTWVRGPRFTPSWEPYVTHPALFLAALALAAAFVVVTRLLAGSWELMPPPPILVAVGLVFGSIMVLAFFNGYFTRLVVTNYRLIIVQGFEVRRNWKIDQLPRSLLRYGPRGEEEERPSVDLDALQTMLGSSASTGFSEAKTIQVFGKQLDQIRAQERRRDPDQTLPG
jgi:hypothetical protein